MTLDLPAGAVYAGIFALVLIAGIIGMTLVAVTENLRLRG